MTTTTTSHSMCFALIYKEWKKNWNRTKVADWHNGSIDIGNITPSLSQTKCHSVIQHQHCITAKISFTGTSPTPT